MNKLKRQFNRIMLRLGYIPKEAAKKSGSAELMVLDSEAREVETYFGVTDKRQKELIGITKIAKAKARHNWEAIAFASKECKHPNELILCAFVLNSIRQREENPLLSLLQNLKNNE